jgi:histidine kinase
MKKQLTKKRHSLVLKIIVSVGVILLLSFSTLAFFHSRQYKKKVMADILADCDRLSEAILLGTHYAMMFNARDDINQIINNMGRLKGLEHVRIYNKDGQIKYSNLQAEVGRSTGIKTEACDICHRTDPPMERLSLNARERIFKSADDTRLMGVITPIYNESGCSSNACHAHPEGKIILGALDVVLSLSETDAQLQRFQNWLALFAVIVLAVTSTAIFFILLHFYITPIRRMIAGTKLIAHGEYNALDNFNKDDEIGHLAAAIHRMGQDIGSKEQALKRQKDEYQHLFELVPCIISVQDKNYKLIGYNREFSKRFAPTPGDYCYSAYKGLSQKCENCPVEKTFEDGLPHYSEETGVNKDGTMTHWIVKTAPMKNEAGEIIGAMEVNLDITHRKRLEVELEQSEKKYYAIFNNIPNAVFVLDAQSFEILDCNDIIGRVYGYSKEEVVGRSYFDFFPPEERDMYVEQLKASQDIEQARQLDKRGGSMFVHIRLSPSQYPGRDVLLVSTSDITDRLEAELKLIQAGKMATLGEMATGIAHELNQPLSVIKTASNYFIKKTRKNEPIDPQILNTMATEIDGHVDRAANIINHLREFGRKSDLTLEKVQMNKIILNAFDLFGQQLKLKEISVIWNLEESLPEIMAEIGRLEQVFINLMINARDAIEEKIRKRKAAREKDDFRKEIVLATYSLEDAIIAEVRDTGVGIPAGNRNKIFEPFFTTKKVGEGTGIGLPISYGIVKDFGGTIQVESTKGQGACFRLSFPRRWPE